MTSFVVIPLKNTYKNKHKEMRNVFKKHFHGGMTFNMKRNIFFKDQTEMLQGSCTAEILISLRAKGFTQNVRAYFMSILAIQQPFNIFNFYFTLPANHCY